jgi:hypothetical protein
MRIRRIVAQNCLMTRQRAIHCSALTLFAFAVSCMRPNGPLQPETHANENPGAGGWSPGYLKPDDPASCLDVQNAKLLNVTGPDQLKAIQQLFDLKLATLVACADTIETQDEEAHLTAIVEDGGRVAAVIVQESTLTDCRPTDCIKSALMQVELPPQVAIGVGSFHMDLLLRRGAPPLFARLKPTRPSERPPRPVSDACVDRQPLESPNTSVQTTTARVIRQNSDRFDGCIGRRGSATSRVDGRVVVRVVLDGDGSVRNSQVVFNTLSDCIAVRCIRDVYRYLAFPSRPGGPVTFEWQHTFIQKY